MFKYISEILKRFSSIQRVLVLILLLLTIIMVLSVPRIVDSLTFNDTELSKRIEIQDFIIQNLNNDLYKLNKDIDTLNNKLRINQIECTNLVIKREKEILEQLSSLQKRAINSVPVRMMDSMSDKRMMDREIRDTTGVYVLRGIEVIKSDLIKSINSKR